MSFMSSATGGIHLGIPMVATHLSCVKHQKGPIWAELLGVVAAGHAQALQHMLAWQAQLMVAQNVQRRDMVLVELQQNWPVRSLTAGQVGS